MVYSPDLYRGSMETLSTAHESFWIVEPPSKEMGPLEKAEVQEEVDRVQKLLQSTKTLEDKWILEEVYIKAAGM